MVFLLSLSLLIALLGCNGQQQLKLFCVKNGIGSLPSLSCVNSGSPEQQGAQVRKSLSCLLVGLN